MFPLNKYLLYFCSMVASEDINALFSVLFLKRNLCYIFLVVLFRKEYLLYFSSVVGLEEIFANFLLMKLI